MKNMKAFFATPVSKHLIDKFNKAGISVDFGTTTELLDRAELVEIINKYDIIKPQFLQKLDTDMMANINTPKVYGSMSIGLDHIPSDWFANPLIKIANIKTANAVSVAEHIFALILALSKRIYESNALVIDGKGHRNHIIERDRPNDISGKTIGLIGAGNITREVIRFATVFNMRILCYTKNPKKHQDLNDKVEFVSLDNLLKESDIINISVPLNDETKYLVSKDKIELMKTTAVFINTSRTNTVDTKALLEYADKHPNFYVGLDIDLCEHRELFMKYRHNVIVTPHTAGISKEAISRMEEELVENIICQAKYTQ